MSDERRECPDGATCHHDCGKRCWRVATCEPLSASGWGDTWPDEVRREHARFQVVEHHVGGSPAVTDSDGGSLVGNFASMESARAVADALEALLEHGADLRWGCPPWGGLLERGAGDSHEVRMVVRHLAALARCPELVRV